jgi:RNA polymerase sigma factor (sigma-70 family)
MSGDVNEETTAEVLSALLPRLRKLISRYQIPSQDGEDLAQEVVSIALLHWKQIEHKDRWLLVATKNLCAAYHRRRKAWDRLVQSVDPSELQALPRIVSPPQENSDRVRDLKRLFAKLDRKHRLLIYLRYYEELGPTELAAQIGCHPANVRKALLRTLARLRFAAMNPDRP